MDTDAMSDYYWENLKDILQRRRKRHPVVHRKAQTVRLTVAVIRVLSDNHDLQPVERAFVECAENIASLRKNPSRRIFGADESRQFLEIGLVEFGLQYPLPILGYLHFHSISIL